MNFQQHFELQKIPEWYSQYLDYDKLKEMIDDFKTDSKSRPNKVVTIKNQYEFI